MLIAVQITIVNYLVYAIIVVGISVLINTSGNFS